MDERLTKRLVAAMEDVPDFPKPGVVFKDLGPVWRDPALCGDLVAAMASHGKALAADAVIGIESRGFLLGMPLALALDVPFVLARKVGKLPGRVHKVAYGLEYGEAVLEMQTSALKPGQRVLVHDDVLATGGTAAACRELVEAAGAEVVGWSFLVELAFLNGRKKLAAADDWAVWSAHVC
jgi:adenine phosphoribosyltransferase